MTNKKQYLSSEKTFNLGYNTAKYMLIPEFIQKLKDLIGDRLPNGKIEWAWCYKIDEYIQEYEARLNDE